MKRDEHWYENYALLKAFIEETGHLPNKKKVENRGLLNWWKYNKKLIKAGKLDGERVRMLEDLSNMRTSIEPSTDMVPSAAIKPSNEMLFSNEMLSSNEMQPSGNLQLSLDL